MIEVTLTMRLPEGEDPTVAEILERCDAARAAFGGELVRWETGNLFDRVEAYREKLQQVREQLYAHGLIEPEAGEVAVAGEVAHVGHRASPMSSPEAHGLLHTLRAHVSGPVQPAPDQARAPVEPGPVSTSMMLGGLREDIDLLARALDALVQNLTGSGIELSGEVADRVASVLRESKGRG